jgi:hypothetical protein
VHISPTRLQLHRTDYPKTTKNSLLLEFYNFKNCGIWHNSEDLNAVIFRKIEKLTFRCCKEFWKIQKTQNVNIFKIFVNIWSPKAKMSMTTMLIMYNSMRTLCLHHRRTFSLNKNFKSQKLTQANWVLKIWPSDLYTEADYYFTVKWMPTKYVYLDTKTDSHCLSISDCL